MNLNVRVEAMLFRSPAWLQRLLCLALRARRRLINGWQRLNQPRWTGHQRRIGLTGGIASGKSSVGRLLRDEHGLPLLDADAYAREAAATTVVERYGDRVRNPRGEIDRAALGRIVFTDPAERAWLEGLIHPLVRARFAAELERRADAPAVVLMIPLLFEAGLEGLCSEIWLVDCDEEQQLGRLIARDGLTEAEARSRIEAQWPLARKRPLADVVIDNRRTTAALVDAVARALAAGDRGGGTVSPSTSR
jgi:dephospho-CoA kinase